MKTAPNLDQALEASLHAEAERIHGRPDAARLLAALDAAPLAMAAPPRTGRIAVAAAAAAVALLAVTGAVAASRQGGDGDGPRVEVTELQAPTTVTVTTVAAVTTLAPTTAAPTTLAPTTVAPTTAAPAPVVQAPVQAAPPVVAAKPAAPRAAATKSAAKPAATKKQAPPTTPGAGGGASVAFSASAAFGSCGEDPPYDVYSGTANPGSQVTISSPYGGGSATADGGGHWSEKVVFAGAPVGDPFSVTVSSPQGSETFTFTHTG